MTVRLKDDTSRLEKCSLSLGRISRVLAVGGSFLLFECADPVTQDYRGVIYVLFSFRANMEINRNKGQTMSLDPS